MSWRVDLAVHILSRCQARLQLPFVRRGIFASWQFKRSQLLSPAGSVLVRHDIVAAPCKVWLRRLHITPISSGKPFSPGLLRVGISSSGAGRTDLSEKEGGVSSDGRQPRKHPYLKYGTHLDPAVFRQLLQGWTTAKQGGGKREVFHPKLTPRIFYNEAKEYEDSAVIYPQIRKTEAAGDVGRNVDDLLDQFQLENRSKEPNLGEILESLHRCSDEELLGKAEDERFIELAQFLARCCPLCKTDEFVKILTLFARVQIRTSNPAMQVLEIQCERRCATWDVATSLLVCDSLRLIGRNARSFNVVIFRQIGQQLDQLTKCQVVQLLYLIGESRHCSTDLLDRLQDLVPKHIDNMSVTELGTACHGFFKSRTSLKPAFISALVRRIQVDPLSHAHSFYLVGILKVFREAYFGHRDLFSHIGRALVPRLQTFPIPSIMHILLTYATLHILDEPLLDVGAQELTNRFQECRCKDVTKFLWSFATLNHCPKDSDRFFKMLINRMVELLGEYEDFPVFLVSGLLSLAYLNIYPAELINIVFSQRFLLRIDDYAKQSGIDPLRDLFLLYASVSIDCPEYKGNHLSKDFFLRRPLSERMFGSLSHELSRRPMLTEVAASVASLLGGREYVKLGFTLPHMKTADIEIVLDSNDAPVALDQIERFSSTVASPPSRTDKSVALDSSLIANLSGNKPGKSTAPVKGRTSPGTLAKLGSGEAPDSNGRRTATGGGALDLTINPSDSGQSFDQSASGDKKPVNQTLFVQRDSMLDPSRLEVPSPFLADREQVRRIAILVWSRNHFHFGGERLLGLHSMKRRQLLTLGYQTVEIPFFEWDKLTGTQAQEDYIQRKILSANKSSN